jgi:hypothetical protein
MNKEYLEKLDDEELLRLSKEFSERAAKLQSMAALSKRILKKRKKHD